MARPHPTVGICAELSDRDGEFLPGGYQNRFSCEHEILVTAIERFYLNFCVPLIVLQELFSDFALPVRSGISR